MKGENPEFLFRFTDEKKLRIALKNNQKKFVCSAQLLQRKPFKYDEKCFLFHLKNSFLSQDI